MNENVVELPSAEKVAEQIKQEAMDAYTRGLRMKLRTLSKKQLVSMCINLAVELYNTKQQLPKEGTNE